ncbi:hypothetical protein BDP27DRAFT_1329946 [Rhodocollybia butyracea]|uniref:Uncharacterized protein n=1 Tax=Rhodocollybia butyracea TaxID=206335 RepID=A0A9P5PNY9_9AGAR|nr:hypothetical protein BDP27DRAFT_1329946 [Rhodocollybia butyracea]
MPSTSSIYEERIELLDKLIDLPLKGFSEIDATPTSGITSLPTPLGNEHPSLEEHVFNAPHENELIYPPTPRFKDLDSFTEGTGGSFDFLADEDSFDDAPSLNSLSLSLLPTQDSLSIEMWREDVFYNSPNTSQPPSRAENTVVEPDCDTSMSDFSLSHSKRPRSVASDDVARRTRPRAQSALASPYSIATQFYGAVEVPVDVRPLVRPQLRRTRSLPLRPD